MKAYFRSIRSLPRTSREEERQGDTDARDQIAPHYIGLVVTVARKFREFVRDLLSHRKRK